MRFPIGWGPGRRPCRRPGQATRRPAYRLALERLEDRTVPSFVAPLSYEAGRFPRSVAVGDFDGDGELDFAVANEGSADVSVLLGNGDGSFQPPRGYAAGPYPRSVAVGDFDGDGDAGPRRDQRRRLPPLEAA